MRAPPLVREISLSRTGRGATVGTLSRARTGVTVAPPPQAARWRSRIRFTGRLPLLGRCPPAAGSCPDSSQRSAWQLMASPTSGSSRIWGNEGGPTTGGSPNKAATTSSATRADPASVCGRATMNPVGQIVTAEGLAGCFTFIGAMKSVQAGDAMVPAGNGTRSASVTAETAPQPEWQVRAQGAHQQMVGMPSRRGAACLVAAPGNIRGALNRPSSITPLRPGREWP